MTQQNPANPAHDFENGVPLAAFDDQKTVCGAVGETPVLVTRHGRAFHAFEAVCTHYGGPLVEGAFDGDTVRCPLHNACFNLIDGRAVAAPAFAGLTRRQVEVVEGKVFVRQAIEAEPLSSARKARPSEPGRIVIIGGGAAGFAAADALRKDGFAGALTMITADNDLPYDRPNLSKDYLAGSAEPEWIPLQDAGFYEDRSIDVKTSTTVTRLDLSAQKIETDSGLTIGYDRLLLATGATARQLPLPGASASRVFTLRSLADTNALIAALDGAQDIVLIGAGFIGLEVAASLRQRDKSVTVVSTDDEPFRAILGKDVGRYIRGVHEAHGVRFIGMTTVQAVEGRKVHLANGETIKADLIVVGIGARPNDELAANAGLAVKNGVIVDAQLRTSANHVFAAGDVARYQSAWAGGHQREEHWVTAQRQGQIAAQNMCGGQALYNDAPFFWTHQFEINLKYSGAPGGWDRVSIEGSLENADFAALYYKGDRLCAIASVGREHESTERHNEIEALYRNALAAPA